MYMYINNILFIANNPTCFDASASSSGSFSFYFAKVIKIVKFKNSIKSVD